jgi:hypothetical protein
MLNIQTQHVQVSSPKNVSLLNSFTLIGTGSLLYTPSSEKRREESLGTRLLHFESDEIGHDGFKRYSSLTDGVRFFIFYLGARHKKFLSIRVE